MKTVALIPAKGNSERLKDKNLLKIGNKSLVYSACEKCLNVCSIDRVYIDTESDEIINDLLPLISKGLNVIRRPVEMASNSTSGNDLIVFEQSMIEKCDLILHTYATSPFITSNTIEKCIQTFISKRFVPPEPTGLQEQYDSFFTALPVKEYFWYNGEPVNFDLNILPNSQNLDTIWMETHGLYGITWDALTKFKRRLGNRVLPIQIEDSEALDINTPLDYKEAIKLYEE